MAKLRFKKSPSAVKKTLVRSTFTFRRILYILLLVIACLIIGLSIFIITYTRSDYNKIPSLKNSILAYYNKESSIITDRNGEIIFDYRSKTKKENLEKEQIPELAKYAILVREDENYYSTGGFSWKNFGGAVIGCIKSRITRDSSDCRGGSGIFQQLVKNYDNPENRDLAAKYNELLRSLKASEEISLDDALAMYLNNMDFGRLSKGIEMGSKAFFSHSVNDQQFNPAKACFLAIMPNQPTGFTTAVRNQILGNGDSDSRPTFRWSYAKRLIDDCIDKLASSKVISYKSPIITAEEAKKWKKYDLIGSVSKQVYDPNNQAKYYIRDYIEEELLTRFKEQFPNRDTLESMLYNKNYDIRTTFDIKLQNKLETTIKANKDKLLQAEINQFSSSVINNQTSELLAMQGNLDYGESQINRLTGQFGYILPGSSTKPYYFASAFNQGFNPATVLQDVSYIDPVIGNIRSNDIVGKYQGYVSMRYGLQQSINTVAEQALYINQDGNDFAFKTGVRNSVDFAKTLGLKFRDGQDQCLEKIDIAVGACYVQGLSHLNAFATLANEGVYNEVKPLIKITLNEQDYVTTEAINSKYVSKKVVADKAINNQIMNVLSDYVTRRDPAGSRSSDAYNYEIPGWKDENAIATKSGTAQIYYGDKNQNGELTVIGGSKNISTLLWAGRVDDKNNKLPIKSGSSAITPIYSELMSKYHEGITPVGFSKAGLIEVKVDPLTGFLAENGNKEYMTQKQIDILKNVTINPSASIFTNRTSVIRDGSCNKALKVIDHFRFVEAQREAQARFGGNGCGSNTPINNNGFKIDIILPSTTIKKTDKIEVITNIEGKNATLNIKLIGPNTYNLNFYSNNNKITLDTIDPGTYKIQSSISTNEGVTSFSEKTINIIK
jgi:penicillin-binding protein 4